MRQKPARTGGNRIQLLLGASLYSGHGLCNDDSRRGPEQAAADLSTADLLQPDRAVGRRPAVVERNPGDDSVSVIRTDTDG